MTHQHSYAPQHARPGEPVPPAKRSGRVVAVVAACVLGLGVVAAGGWFVMDAVSGDAADLDEFCKAADSYFALTGQPLDDADRTRDFVIARVDTVDRMLRSAPQDIRPTVADYAADVEAGAAAFERGSYAAGLVQEAMAGTLEPPEDAAAVLRLAGYSYVGDAGGQRAGEIAAYRGRHCVRGGSD